MVGATAFRVHIQRLPNTVENQGLIDECMTHDMVGG